MVKVDMELRWKLFKYAMHVQTNDDNLHNFTDIAFTSNINYGLVKKTA